jgi:hypothetical protein
MLASKKRLGILNDIHIGIHDDVATRVVIEVMEDAGVDFVIANGDIHDCAAVSRHQGKSRLAAVETGQLAEEIAGGRWIIDWLCTRPTVYGVGNHEDWINDLALATNTIGTLTVRSALAIPDSIAIVPSGYLLRHGNLAIEHGDKALIGGGRGQYIASALLRRYPDQTTLVGHFHREDVAVATTLDNRGVSRMHGAYCIGHLSLPDKHMEYAGRSPNWQQGAAIVNLWEADARPRFSVNLLRVHRDRRNRPMVEYNGKVYK